MPVDAVVDRLTEEECWRRLAAAEVCRLAFLEDGRIEVLPVNYAPVGRRLLLASADLSPVARSVGGPVTVEVDGWTDEEAWSVVVRGPLLPVDIIDERPGSRPWIPSAAPRRRFEVLPIEVRGRRFDRTPRPHEEGTFGPPSASTGERGWNRTGSSQQEEP